MYVCIYALVSVKNIYKVKKNGVIICMYLLKWKKEKNVCFYVFVYVCVCVR